MSLEELHWRLSAHPAICAGFRNRGTLVEGAWADIVVYHLNKLTIKPMEIVHDFPGGEWRHVQQAEGYHAVTVNGEVTFEEGRIVCCRKPKVGPTGNIEVDVVGVGPSCGGKCRAFKDWSRFRDCKSLEFPLPCVGAAANRKYAQHEQRKECTRTHPVRGLSKQRNQAEPHFISSS
jgi:hypothetical protein